MSSIDKSSNSSSSSSPSTSNSSSSSSAAPSSSSSSTSSTTTSSSSSTSPSSSASSPSSPVKVHVRLLILSRYGGGLIGRGGATISQLRTESGCQIDVSDPVKGATHRIVTLRGAQPAVVKAAIVLAQKLAEIEHDNAHKDGTSSSSSSSSSSAANHQELVMLVCDTQVGSLLGRGGSRISELRSSSKASIRISDESIDSSNEKTVTVRGDQQQLHAAITSIVAALADSSHRALGRALYIPRGGDNPMSPSSSSVFSQSSAAAAAAAAAASSNRSHHANNESNVPLQTVMVGVPDAMMGGVIGKKGAVIREIRSRSGATISIGERAPSANSNGDTAAQDRIITITGSPSATQIAIAMICERTTQFQQSQSATQTAQLPTTPQQPNIHLKRQQS